MSKVVEYLGLPAVGKSWQLDNNGYCSAVGATPDTVPLNGGKAKAVNTILGIASRPKLFFLLLWSTLSNPSTFNIKTSLRPIFVVPERIGRRHRIIKKYDVKTIHTDEGAVQFLWRVFYEKNPTNRNLRLLRSSLMALQVEPGSVVYFYCNKKIHLERIRKRSKRQPFDQNAIAGNMNDYECGRLWMAHLLRFLRNSGIKLPIVVS